MKPLEVTLHSTQLTKIKYLLKYEEARVIRRANILNCLTLGYTSGTIAQILNVSPKTVQNVANTYRENGLDSALYDDERSGRPIDIDDRERSRIVAMVCSDPPDGQYRWTLELIVDEVEKRQLASQGRISKEKIRIILKEHDLKPWQEKMWCIGDLDETYIDRMEDVLEVYERPHDPSRPLICIDEKVIPLIGDTKDRKPAEPGSMAKTDYEYIHNGSVNVFCGVEPKAGKYFNNVTERRTGKDFAEFIEFLSGEYSELKALPISEWPEGAVDYAKLDARATFELYLAQIKQSQGEILADAPAQCRADFALKLAANRGMITCPKRVARFSTGLEQEFNKTRQLLLDGGLLKEQKKKSTTVFVRDTKKAQARLLNILGDNVEKTPTGLIKVDEDSCVASNDPLLLKYSRFLKLQTLMSKDAAILRRGTREPIHTSFNVLVNTGRTSSRNPNMQNPRREPGVRECFVPRPGYVFASADYDAAELHTLAQACLHFCGFSVLSRQLNAGIDPHLALAAKLLKITYGEAQALKNNDDTKVLKMRQMAKAANFGFPGGMGPRGFRAYAKGYGFNISLDDAAALRKDWLANFPEMAKYFRYIGAKVGRAGVTNICHLVSKRKRGLVNYTAACNSYFQGLAADGAKKALFAVQQECHAEQDSALFGSHVVNFLHDEIIIETPEAGAHDAATRLAHVMVQNFNHFVPDVPVTASPQLMRLWSKKAKPIFDISGRLVPWEDK